MKRSLVGLGLGLGIMSASAQQNLPVWQIHTLVGVTQPTVDYYGGLAAVQANMRTQLDSVQSWLAQGGFNGTYQITIDSIYAFSSNLSGNVNAVPDNKYDWKIILDALPAEGSNWYPKTRTFLFAWDVDNMGGPFTSLWGDKLVLQAFSLLRGGYDLPNSWESTNPVDSLKYANFISSVTGSVYQNNTFWDPTSKALMNYTAGKPGYQINFDQSNNIPDTIQLRAVDSNGVGVPHARVNVYPVAAYSDKVTTTPIIQDSTDNNGYYYLNRSVFGLHDSTQRYGTTYSNMLATFTSAGVTKAFFVPLDSLVLTKITIGDTYKHIAKLPIKAPDTAINLGVYNKSTYVLVNGTGTYTINQFPNWSFSKVVLAFNAINAPLNGSVYVNGNLVGTISGWYQTINIPQTSTAPITINFVTSSPQQVNLQWWVYAN